MGRHRTTGKGLPVGVYRHHAGLQFVDPITGTKKLLKGTTPAAIAAEAASRNLDAMARIIDTLGDLAFPQGNVHPDFLHTRLHISRNAQPAPKPSSVVYFLLRNGAVVYVGRTNNLGLRLRQHVTDKTGKFDSYYVLSPSLPADIVEAYYILKFEPPGNRMRAGLTTAIRKKFKLRRRGKGVKTKAQDLPLPESIIQTEEER